MKQTILEYLREVTPTADNFERLKSFLTAEGYFQMAGGVKHHSVYKGGLMEHSLHVLTTFKSLCEQCSINVSAEVIVHASLLHDICKCRTQIFKNGKWQDSGIQEHAELSLKMLEEISYPISEQAKALIKYHMGPYGSFELGGRFAEYSLMDYVINSNKDRTILLFHTADLLSATFMEERQCQ